MAKRVEKPSVGEVSVEVQIGPDTETRTGRDLDDVLRWVITELRDRSGWSTYELARRLGVSRGTIRQILDPEGSGTSLAILSRICAALKVTPDALFQSFPAYAPDNRASVRFADDVVFDRFRTVLDAKQAKRALGVFDEAKRRGVLEQFLDVSEAQFPAPASEKRRRKSQ